MFILILFYKIKSIVDIKYNFIFNIDFINMFNPPFYFMK